MTYPVFSKLINLGDGEQICVVDCTLQFAGWSRRDVGATFFDVLKPNLPECLKNCEVSRSELGYLCCVVVLSSADA